MVRVSPCLPMDSAVHLCCFTAACYCCVQVCVHCTTLDWPGQEGLAGPVSSFHCRGWPPSLNLPSYTLLQYFSLGLLRFSFHSDHLGKFFTRPMEIMITTQISTNAWKCQKSTLKVSIKCQFVPESTANKACVTFQILTAQLRTLSTAAAQFSEVGIGRGHWWWG